MPTTELPRPPTEDEPAKDTTRRFSPEETRLLAEMMNRPEVKGNLAASVALLQKEHPATDWNYQRCYKLTRTNGYLNAFAQCRNPEGLVPKGEDTIDCSAPDTILTPAEQRELVQVVQQAKKVEAKDWVSLGLTEGQATRMLSMEAFARMPMKAMIDTTHGSMMFSLGVLLQNFEDTSKRIAGNLLPDEFDKEGNPRPAIDVERDWHQVLLAYSREIRAIKDQVDRGILLAAKVAQMTGTGKGKGRGKPGFGPMTVNAQPGSKVAIVSQQPHGEGR